MNELELIEHILEGNKDAYRQIVDKYKPMIFRVSMGFIHNKEEADDISQEVFINAYLHLDTFKAKSAFQTWLYRIAVNTCLNHIRNKQKRGIFQRIGDLSGISRQNDQRDEMLHEPGPDQQLIDKQNAGKITKAIDSLPEKQRVVFILSKYDELSQKEIAKITDTTEGAVEQLLQRAKSNLRLKLEDFYKKNYK
jgi:RNA polymerase sigma-70 factor, ECF subfamily